MSSVAPSVDAVADLWGEVVGQPQAVAQLRAAAAEPVHAYLLVGPHGAGKMAAARAFAGSLMAADAAVNGLDGGRSTQLVAADLHPDVRVFAPEGARLLVAEAREIVALAARTPVEGSRKVIVIDEAHRLEEFGAVLLKTIEEPPASTVFVILAEEVPPDLVTIASRAARIDLGPVPKVDIEGRLVAEGIPAPAAADAAMAAAGDLSRARLLATDDSLADRRRAWANIPNRLDDTGATAAVIVDELIAMIESANAPLAGAHAAEAAELAERIEITGERRSLLKDLDVRHRREARRARTQELRMGLATLAATYRAALSDDARRDDALAALERIQAVADALIRNPNESLLLLNLVAHLPPSN